MSTSFFNDMFYKLKVTKIAMPNIVKQMKNKNNKN